MEKNNIKDKKIRWGILGSALIAEEHLIPAIKKTTNGEVAAIASRSLDKAKDFAQKNDIPLALGSYEELIEHPEIDVIYNPLPNHLHVDLSIKAAQAGKHILCEKPAAMSAEEAVKLRAIPENILFMEAFMVRFHPQWLKVRELIDQGKIGELKAMQAFFCYFNKDKNNIRNIAEIGGGGMYDIGCYPTTISKFIFRALPRRVASLVDYDAEFKTDKLVSAIYDFGAGRQLTFGVSTQLAKYQRVNLLGTEGRLEVQIPFNAPGGEKTKIFFDDGKALDGSRMETIVIQESNQYHLQCEAFNQAILNGEKLPYGVEDAIDNSKILDSVFRAAKTNQWEIVE